MIRKTAPIIAISFLFFFLVDVGGVVACEDDVSEDPADDPAECFGSGPTFRFFAALFSCVSEPVTKGRCLSFF